MKLSDKQISLISSLINEGLSVQKDSDITKKKYLEKAVSKLISNMMRIMRKYLHLLCL